MKEVNYNIKCIIIYQITCIHIQYDAQLRSNVANQNFFAILSDVSTKQTRKNNFNFNKTGLSPNTSYSLSVLANNGVLNSSEASTITNTTWPFPPQLRIITNTNVSLVAMVTLEECHSVLQTLEAYIMEVRYV